MRSLLLIRHAKSSWDSPTLQDFDRPLNDRGHRDAAMMARRLTDKHLRIDAFVTSTAQRALSTAGYFHQAFKAPPERLIKVPALYHAPPEVFYQQILTFDDEWETVAMFAHNPGITAMVNSLNVARLDDMPTCGIFGVTAITDHWSSFASAEKRFWFFDSPKG